MDNDKLNHMIGNSIIDVPCPHCGEEVKTHPYNEGKVDSSRDGTRYYYVDYHCEECDKDFYVHFVLKIKVTKATH